MGKYLPAGTNMTLAELSGRDLGLTGSHITERIDLGQEGTPIGAYDIEWTQRELDALVAGAGIERSPTDMTQTLAAARALAWDMPARTASGDQALTAADHGHLIEIDASAGDATASLPAASALPPTGRMLVAIGKSDASEHSVTITVAGNGEIDNAGAIVLERQNQRALLRAGIDGENTRWQTIASANASEAIPNATTETAGVTRYATAEEAAAGVVADAALTPAAAGARARAGLNLRAFTASGVFTVPTGVSALEVIVIGGGGGGGGTALGLVPVTPETTVMVTIGTGGKGRSNSHGGAGRATSFGSYLSATGGAGGRQRFSSGAGGDGGPGGLGVGGAWREHGQRGAHGSGALNGTGGWSFMGYGGSGAGSVAIGPGAGGGGTSGKGGDGHNGACFIRWIE